MHQHFLQESVCEGDQNDLPFWFTNNQHYLSLFPSLLMGELRQLGLFGGCWERRVTIFSSGTNMNSEISRFRSGNFGFTRHRHVRLPKKTPWLKNRPGLATFPKQIRLYARSINQHLGMTLCTNYRKRHQSVQSFLTNNFGRQQMRSTRCADTMNGSTFKSIRFL